MASETPSLQPDSASSARGASLKMVIAAIGIVFGDIGTSPLYSMSTALGGAHRLPLDQAYTLGIASLLIWLLFLVVTFKYVGIVMRAHNEGEGGVLALMALIQKMDKPHSWWIVGLGCFAAALFFGDGIITPAISVLSAIEGLELVNPGFDEWVIPLALGVLLILFIIQRHGTERVGALFGPVMILWFVVLAVLGVGGILQHPAIFAALDPRHGLLLLWNEGPTALIVLGGAILAVTGAEALYADMGHFGARPIRHAWLGFVLPALVLNYLGQAALVLEQPAAILQPFFLLAPRWAFLPLVILATAATVIASQAVISGAFSMTHQAMQLGFLPHLKIVHTSHRQSGQIYVPPINRLLLIGTVLLVVVFQTSGSLAGAYGLAIAGTMAVTTTLVIVVAHGLWKWSALRIALLIGPLLCVDLGLLAATTLKLLEGGWLPLTIAVFIALVMVVWRLGLNVINRFILARRRPLSDFFTEIDQRPLAIVPKTGIFVARIRDDTLMPLSLLANLRANDVLHARTLLVWVTTVNEPFVVPENRADVETLHEGISRIRLRFGFMEDIEVEEALRQLSGPQDSLHIQDAVYFVANYLPIPKTRDLSSILYRGIFVFLFRNGLTQIEIFGLPHDRSAEVTLPMPL